jgi:acylglycerol lipase
MASDHGAVWRFFSRVPVIGSLLWVSDPGHSCGSSPLDPSDSDAHRAIMGGRFFRSSTTHLLVRYRTWQQQRTHTRGIVYILHGFAEYSGRYEHVASLLTSLGFDVVALDHQGHGESEGDRAHIGEFKDYVSDVLQLVRTVCPAPEGVPRFLLGHSMGGLIALHTAHASQALWSGLILSGPGLVFDPAVDTPVNRFLARALASLLPKLEVQTLNTATLCTDPVVVRQYERDPLVYHGALRVRMGNETIKAVEEVRTWAGELTLPLLIVHGEKDVLCNPAGSTWLVGAIGSADKTLKVYPGLYHEIFMEAQGPSIVREVAEWMGQHLGGAAAAGEAAGEEGKGE